MLDPLDVRILSGLTAMGVLVGLVLFRSQGSALGGGFREVRAERRVPRALEILWVAVVIVPLFALFAGAGWPELVLSSPLSVRFPADTALQLLGYGLLAVGGFLAFTAIRHLGKFMVIQIAVSRDHQLVTSGPYGRIRHPLYTGLMMMTIGAAMFYLNVALLVDAIVVIAIAHYRAGIEEALLSSPQGFGLVYRAYVARTGRFLPKPRLR
ncbi:MAG TPA: isoprenylcysteine carboxylmethyltransferase family protein [Thermoplasmata archaeon]|nr:isoprenylcysteine carboxylmethyltransferase family protein [Thermoplasmata archaeon]